MELSQENKYVLECFEKNFKSDVVGRVIIYGVGNNTRVILENAKADNIMGLMDSSCEGQIIMGFPVLTMQEAVKKGDCVVIVARNSVVPIIFERIRVLEEKWGFPVYNIQGERLIQKKRTEYRNDNPYWEKSEQALLDAILCHVTISFDIFDTLIMRRCMVPQDLFFMQEQELKKLNIESDGFVSARREAEAELKEQYPTLSDIYEKVRKKMGWTEKEKREALEREIELEKRNCIPREYMRQIYQKVLQMGKKIILVSDMYLPGAIIRDLLEQCGISGYERLYISCEQKADKNQGQLYQKIIRDGYDEILHIGDNEKPDGQSAQACGIDSYTIMSAYEMLVQSSMRDILSYADSLEKRACVGIIVKRLFDNPFYLNESKGKVRIERLYDIGYIFLAPVIRCFLAFVKAVLEKRNADRILFCARDGYVIWRLYRKLREHVEGLPEGVYFKTSRRAITVAAIEGEEDIDVILKKPYCTTMGELLSTRFGVLPRASDEIAGYKAVSTENAEQVRAYIISYAEEIIKNAAKERNAYQKYMRENGITDGKEVIVYDFCSGGTIQYYLHKFIDGDIRGVYFATVNLPNIFYQDSSRIDTLFENIGQYEKGCHLARHYMFMEGVLTDGNGTLIRFAPNGEAVYDEQENTRRDYQAILEIQRGIETYCGETMMEDWYEEFQNMKVFADEILGCFFKSEVCQIPEKLKNIVRAESAYDFLPAYSAWSEE